MPRGGQQVSDPDNRPFSLYIHLRKRRADSGPAPSGYWAARMDTSDGTLDEWRRRLLFRARRRGTREMDMVIFSFAEARVPVMAAGDLAAFEVLLDLPDPELFAWVIGAEAVPPRHNSSLLRDLIAFHGGTGPQSTHPAEA